MTEVSDSAGKGRAGMPLLPVHHSTDLALRRPLDSVPYDAGSGRQDEPAARARDSRTEDGSILAAELALLRAELDLLKRAFRRHCIETG